MGHSLGQLRGAVAEAWHSVLTQYDNEADEYGPQGAHAQLEALSLLDQLAVLAPIALRADAPIPEPRLQIDAGGPVQAGQVQALVPVHTALGVRGHDATLAATAMELEIQRRLWQDQKCVFRQQYCLVTLEGKTKIRK